MFFENYKSKVILSQTMRLTKTTASFIKTVPSVYNSFNENYHPKVHR